MLPSTNDRKIVGTILFLQQIFHLMILLHHLRIGLALLASGDALELHKATLDMLTAASVDLGTLKTLLQPCADVVET